MENFTNLYKDDERVNLKEGWISLRWCIEDVDYVIEEHGYVFNPELTRDEKMNVLLYTLKWHDATCGVSWNTLNLWINELYGGRMKRKTMV